MKQTYVFGIIALVIVALVGFFIFFFNGGDEGATTDEPRIGGLFGSLFPFRAPQQVTDEEPDDIQNNGGATENNSPVPALRNVSGVPAVGGVFFSAKEGVYGVRYIERGSGHIYETTTDSLSTKRVSNTTIPGIQEALWLTKDKVIIRYLNEEGATETFAATLASTTREQSLNGSFIASWEKAALDTARKTLFSVTKNTAGASFSLSNVDGSQKRAVYSSPIRSWIPLMADSELFLQSAPASGVPGYLYRLSGSTLIKLIDAVPGLASVVSPTGRYILFSSGVKDDVALGLLDTETGTIFESPVHTIANKCAFLTSDGPEVVCGVPSLLPPGQYPDDWNLGRLHFSDDVWLVDPRAGVAELIASPEIDAEVALDVMNPVVSPDSNFLGFTDKNSLSFWLLSLSR